MSEANMSEANKIRKVVIVGRDEALWLAASILRASYHRTALEIVAVELPSRRSFVDVIPTLRNQQAFHSLLNIPEGPLMGTAHATFTLGQRFVGFSGTEPPFTHPYGTYGSAINRVRFHQFWVRAHKKGQAAPFDTFSLNATAAGKGRFFLPDNEIDEVAECDYGYHFDAVAYCQVLKQLLLARGGVMHVEAAGIGGVTRDPASGDIASVQLANGHALGGDLFIDATGQESLLLGGAMQAPLASWAEWFPCDRVMTAMGPPISPLPAFSQIAAFRSGWAMMTPLRNRTGVQLVYRAAELADADAARTASKLTGLPLAPDMHFATFSPGLRQSWVGNCIGIGEAAAAFDPIDNVSLQSIMLGLSHLTSLLPLDRDMAPERKEFNLNVTSGLERLRDYQICHYKLNKRVGEPMWDQSRDMAVPDALAYKIKLFDARGHLVEYDDETFVEHDWYAVFLGHGLIPRAYDPVVDQTPDADVTRHFQRLQTFIKDKVADMKPMDRYFTHNG